MAENVENGSGSSGSSNVTVLGISFFIGNIIVGLGIGGFGISGVGILLMPILYILMKNDNVPDEKLEKAFNGMMNFTISYLLYFIVSVLLTFVLIGFLFIAVFMVTFTVSLIIGFVKHLKGEPYEYPMTIKFLK